MVDETGTDKRPLALGNKLSPVFHADHVVCWFF